ncbi:MAG: hypothetical protein KH330_07210 [Clostridiales bacterium]|nr:hypothetical protein [Clostridiales bacterium]
MSSRLIKKVLIVCYYGKFPDWMNIWLKSCELNPDFDFIIITDIPLKEVPNNVVILNYSMEELRTKFSEAAGFDVVLKSPYKLCDYKPMYGKALKEHIKDYTFWGYCDIDLIWGDLSNFITNDILNKYDLIGIYGHLMLYRNIDYMNNLFKLEGGTFDYKEVFSHSDNYSFDEMSGMDLIARENSIRHFKALKIANISPDYDRFKIAETRTEKEYFVWEHGKILRIYGSEAQYSEEYAYIHFSGKKPENLTSKRGINDANIYLSAKKMSDRVIGLAKINELVEHNEYVSDENDINILKKAKINKIKRVMRMSMKQKIIWFKVHRGISKFKKNEGDNK